MRKFLMPRSPRRPRSPSSMCSSSSGRSWRTYSFSCSGRGSVDDNLSATQGDQLEVVLEKAMARVEDEFWHLMIRNTGPLDAADLRGSIGGNSLSFENEHVDVEVDDIDSDPLSSSHLMDAIDPDAVANLREMADRMITAECHKELCQLYSSVWRDVLDECLSAVLGVGRVSFHEEQKMDWNILADKINKWIHAMRVLIWVLLPCQRRLCETIFAISAELINRCFVESSKGCVMRLLNFGNAIAIGPRSPEKLFRILDTYGALSEAMPELKRLFESDFVAVEAERVLVRLGDAARGAIDEFANAVKKEASREILPSGDIHPMTGYVMNYVKALVDYSSSLDSLVEGGDDDKADSSESGTLLGRKVRLLISYLESNLEEKAKLYEDTALQYIFLMNNKLYIIHEVKGSNIVKFLDDNWVRKCHGQIGQYHHSYFRASWTRVLSFFKDAGMFGARRVSTGGASRMIVKDRFKNFNLAFDEIYKTQTTWKVVDPQLREELGLSMSVMVVLAYRTFLGRFGYWLETVRRPDKYIKYTPEELEILLLNLFEPTSN